MIGTEVNTESGCFTDQMLWLVIAAGVGSLSRDGSGATPGSLRRSSA